jgi:hypothetical protein
MAEITTDPFTPVTVMVPDDVEVDVDVEEELLLEELVEELDDELLLVVVLEELAAPAPILTV